MADPRMRPRYAVDVSCEVETLVAALEQNVERADPSLEGHFDPAHCVVRIPDGRRAFWSPELDLTFERRVAESGEPVPGYRVRCLFRPVPAVWTGFAFIFAVLGAGGVAGVLFGMAQLTLGRTPTALWALPVALVLAGLAYASSFIGQGLALSQMYELRRTLEVSIENAEQRARGYQI